MKPVTIAIDAMSGDRGADVVASAALDAVKENEALSLVLVGIRSELEALLHPGHSRIRIVEAADVVRMNERPSHALRHKRNSSMAVALGLVRDGVAQGCVSAGNTGALMAFGRSVIRMYPGIERPAIAKLIPSLRGRCHVLDLGANVDSTAENLYQYALMGSLMASAICNQPEPRVALLNVGEEEIKGNEQVRLASHMLAQCDTINYIGYIEGSDLFRDVADVVVCDGFVGNIALKTGEGVAGLLIELLEQAFTKTFYGKCVGFFARPIIGRLLRLMDPSRHNGASLLGLQGVVIKSHGNANERAMLAAIRQAVREVELEVPSRINDRLDDLMI
ncbi:MULTISPECIES: phosphate acyltransferase PlsX [Marinobacter]|uniref:phosphate acyltransferase PlsX n=1 Tax=Marinobacter TaxID=2742 RepID=UPI00068CD0C6|nr:MULTISPECIES: phosphate acyltransferase PlsX [Marinobacter]AZR42556.1 glycerol-3-phosphate 1-O-acyltransferase [Marinobacter salarius]MCC4282626.1 phosphate acyltransferase PlsX [Marinobacter salarius]MCZ4286172.1 phosphate acyltransferase PlsX [Marinobacter salarius]MDP4532246.1 phosphate acyltransferase PlsX [Marinobacter salarius]OLF85042.1 phosphate acyltransferase [Marinobacter sp. C18]